MEEIEDGGLWVWVSMGWLSFHCEFQQGRTREALNTMEVAHWEEAQTVAQTVGSLPGCDTWETVCLEIGSLHVKTRIGHNRSSA